MATFSIDVSYGQIAVFHADLASPFNDWRDEHVAQGFSWRAESVSFRTLQDGRTEVSVRQTPRVQPLRPDTVRAIAVPFTVPPNGVEVASIADGQALQLPPGEYRLVFAHGRGANGDMWCSFELEPAVGPVDPEILRADGALTPGARLVMGAAPA